MINGPDQTYIERKGKLEIANIKFRDEEHLFQVAQRIVNRVGRRVDQTTPLADARLADGSRVNVIVPPLSLKGTAISIRKFSDKPITLDIMAKGGSMSEKMATVLKIAGACRFNIVISGGTGSGKTTMLNALRSEEHTSELQSLMRISYAVFCLTKKTGQLHSCIPPTTAPSPLRYQGD